MMRSVVLVTFFVTATCFTSTVVSSSDELEHTVRVLQSQVATLLEAKEQQLQLVDQLKELRQEVDLLREKCRGLKNVGTRTKWLEGSLSEARGQISELGAAVDRAETSISTLKNQVNTNTQSINKISALKEKEPHNNNELHNYNEEWENELIRSVSDVEKKTRHHRIVRKRLEGLETTSRYLMQSQRDFQIQLDSMSDRLSSLEGSNATSVDKVRASMLELLESVEALESKVDSNLPTVQKEISRAEVNLGQVMQQSAVIKEEQDNQKLSLKALSAGLSTIQDKISQFSPSNSSVRLNELRVDTNASEVIAEMKTIIDQFKNVVEFLPQDCSAVDGRQLKLIQLGHEPRLVACGDGWTIVQRRKDGSVPFNRDWEEYAAGFGRPEGEFWIGNAALHELTRLNDTELTVEMVDIYGKQWNAHYGEFRVGDRLSGFKLSVSDYSGNASDALDYQNGMQFSARDSDRDISNTHCAANYEGGWWFSHCQHANLNGRYNLGLTWFHAAKNEWIAVAESTMKIRRKPSKK